MAALFLAMNRGAYRGYFSDDEVDNLSWTPFVSGVGFAKALATPLFLEYNFRPVGHFYFKEMEKYFGLDFPKYVLGIHVFHLFNAWLLWVLARRLGAAPFSAGAAVLFFAFHMALFDALWKPMYVFDVLCGTLCLLSIVFYTGRRWVLSFLAFWMAYKSKELAVTLPAVEELMIQGFEEALDQGPLAKEKMSGVKVKIVDATLHEDNIHRGRLDYRLSNDGEFYLLEANPNPQIAKNEDFADSAAHCGIPYPQLLQKIIMLGLNRNPVPCLLLAAAG